MPGWEGLRGKLAGLPRSGHHGPLGKKKSAVVKDFVGSGPHCDVEAMMR